MSVWKSGDGFPLRRHTFQSPSVAGSCRLCVGGRKHERKVGKIRFAVNNLKRIKLEENGEI